MTLLLRSLVLCNALVLALPAGWCCSLPSAPIEEPVGTAACPHCAPKKQKHEEHSGECPRPATPTSTCDCQPDSLAKVDVERVAIDPGLVLTPVLSIPEPTLPRQPGAVPVNFHSHSPPQYLLHCAWLC
jgi:hypothetical protein